MTEESVKLIENNTMLYYDYFHKHHIKDEDMRQELMLNLCQRVDSYDPKKGKFTTFVYLVFNASVANYLKHTQAQKEKANHVSIHFEDKPTDSDTDWHEMIADNTDDIDDYEYQMMLQDVLERISKSNVLSESVVRAYMSWLKTDSFAESGRELDVSRQFIQNSVKKVQKYIQSIPGVDWRK